MPWFSSKFNSPSFFFSFEKMNVLRAIQIFSPAVTSSLKFLKDTGDERFMNVESTISYMKHMYHFFQFHNVSSTSHYIHSLDSTVAPYVHISDERLHWLNVTFQNFIDDVQNSSLKAGLHGLSKETAHALKFTARSTYLCVKFLLEQVGFYYVLTRSFAQMQWKQCFLMYVSEVVQMMQQMREPQNMLCVRSCDVGLLNVLTLPIYTRQLALLVLPNFPGQEILKRQKIY